MNPEYFVKHPDGTFSSAYPQPVLTIVSVEQNKQSVGRDQNEAVAVVSDVKFKTDKIPVLHDAGDGACGGLAFYSLKQYYYSLGSYLPSSEQSYIEYSDGTHPDIDKLLVCETCKEEYCFITKTLNLILVTSDSTL